MREAEDSRVEDALEMVHILARKWNGKTPSHISFEDLRGEGYLALVKCVERHDESKGCFRAFSYKRVNGAMVDMLRKSPEWSRDKGVVASIRSMDVPFSEESETTLKDMLPCRTESIGQKYVRKERFRDLCRCKAILKPRKKMMVDLFIQGYRLHEIGTMLGCTESNVSSQMKSSVAEMAEHLKSLRDADLKPFKKVAKTA